MSEKKYIPIGSIKLEPSIGSYVISIGREVIEDMELFPNRTAIIYIEEQKLTSEQIEVNDKKVARMKRYAEWCMVNPVI